MVREVGATLDLQCFGAYPLSFVSKVLRAAQKLINHQSQTAALFAIEHFYLHSASENRPDRSPSDYLPFELEVKTNLFDIFSDREKAAIQVYLDNFVIGPKIHGLLAASGWVEN
jgi:hypothetical protein